MCCPCAVSWVSQSDAGVGIGMGWGGVGPHGRGPLGAQRDPMGGDPWEWEPLGAQGIPWEGVPDPPWEGNPWEPKGSHGRGPLGPPVGAIEWERHNIKWERPVNGNAITLNGNARVGCAGVGWGWVGCSGTIIKNLRAHKQKV